MTDQYDDDIILSELPNDELVEQMHDDLYDGLAEEVAEGTQILLDRDWSASKVLEEALVGGMAIVGVDFRDGVLFVPEVLMAANSMKAGMKILKPILSASGAQPVGKVVVGTVKGDIHDIGKSIVGSFLSANGFTIHDMGRDVSAEAFIDKAIEVGADVIASSALLTTTMKAQAELEKILTEKSLKGKIKTIIGGVPVNQDWADKIGADGYAEDAAGAAKKIKELIGG